MGREAIAVPLTRPLVDIDATLESLRDVLASGRLTSGEWTRRFEDLVAEHVGTAHAVATSSATAAIHLALAAQDIGPGDEVLAADFTFPATGNAVIQTGAVPILVDSRPGAFDLDLEDAAAKVSANTRALLVVHPFGQPVDLAGAAELCATHGLVLIEDAACALGASREGLVCGAVGTGCFSFHPRKVITTGEGGMLTTDDAMITARCRRLRDHGGEPAAVGMTFLENGFNYRLSELQAAFGCQQMALLEVNLTGRREAARHYLDILGDWEWAQAPISSETSTFQSFVVLLRDDVPRDALSALLRANGIETTLGTYAMHAHPAFADLGYRPGDLPNSFRAQQQSLTLPLWPGMPVATIEQVCDALSRSSLTPSG